ncbi:uncharacterized protein BX664DRAFT_341387 [Halteromyces radiatus]|uniref:uncharacterized protein n=1 Tax=Halteromyces radiatus TaxID=101107 RepID=UPI00221F2F53|nr:uncharacterized protein BX664DRAFT_341387 [Halteromyces radiatus]KAI8079755.1 hypothetical protein BX664DRAFT_341387 [Halteromyces radiatus]
MKLTRQRINDLKKVFNQIDKDDTELLDKTGLEEALNSLGYEHVDVDHLLKQVDREDFVIFEDFKDIILYLEQKNQVDQNEQDIGRAFQLLADPQLGGITLNRLQELAKAQGQEWTRKEMEEMITIGDWDHDGLVTQDDFIRIWHHAGL